MGICGLKGNFGLVSHPKEEETKHRHRRSQLKTRKKINADYSQLPNEIKHIEHNKSYEKGQKQEQKQSKKQQQKSHAGLKNLGNTCFINAALQCLLNVQSLSDYFLSEAHLAELNLENPMGSKGRITSVLAQIIDQITYEDTQFVVPENFLRVIRDLSNIFGNGSQQDSQEFLIFLLDYLHEDLNRVKVKPYIVDKEYSSNDSSQFEGFARESWQNYLLRNKSIVVDLFQGQLKSTLKCLECNTVTHKFETFMYLSVPVPNHVSSSDLSAVKIEDCIADFTKEELLDPSEQWKCTKCSVKTKSTKKIDLWKTPNILIVHLKRFQYSKDSLGEKVNTMVDFKLKEFDLSKSVAGKEKYQPVYDLFAVCNHQGSLWGGHYTACAKNWETDEWFNFDDSRVTPLLNDYPEKQLVTSEAYVLFYCKTTVDRFQRQTISHPENWPHFNISSGISSRKIGNSQRDSKGNIFSTLAINKQGYASKDGQILHVSNSQFSKCENSYSEKDINKDFKDEESLNKGIQKSIDQSQLESCNQLETINGYQKRKISATTSIRKISDEKWKIQIPANEQQQQLQRNSTIIKKSAVDKISEYQPVGLLTGIRSKRMTIKRKSNIEGSSEIQLPVKEFINCDNNVNNQGKNSVDVTSFENQRIEQRQETQSLIQKNKSESIAANQLENKLDQDEEKQLRICLLKELSVNLKMQDSPVNNDKKDHEHAQICDISLSDNQGEKSEKNDCSSYLTSIIPQEDILLITQNIASDYSSPSNRFSKSDKKNKLSENITDYNNYQNIKNYDPYANRQIKANDGLTLPQTQQEWQGKQRSSTFLPQLEDSNSNLRTDDSSGKFRSRYKNDFSKLNKLRRSSENNKDSWADIIQPDRNRTITEKSTKTAETKKIFEIKKRSISRQNTYENGNILQNTKNHEQSTKQVMQDSSSGSINSYPPQIGLHYHLNDMNNYKKLVAFETLKKINNYSNASLMSHSNSSSYSNYSNNQKQDNLLNPNQQSSSQIPHFTQFSSSNSSNNPWIQQSSRLNSEPQRKRTESAQYSTVASTFDQTPGRTNIINLGLRTAAVISNPNQSKNFSNSENTAILQKMVIKKPPLLPRSSAIH